MTRKHWLSTAGTFLVGIGLGYFVLTRIEPAAPLAVAMIMVGAALKVVSGRRLSHGVSSSWR